MSIGGPYEVLPPHAPHAVILWLLEHMSGSGDHTVTPSLAGGRSHRPKRRGRAAYPRRGRRGARLLEDPTRSIQEFEPSVPFLGTSCPTFGRRLGPRGRRWAER